MINPPDAHVEEQYVSVVVRKTKLTGGGVIHIPFADKKREATNYSIYLRDKNPGTLHWIEDISCSDDSEGLWYSRAIVKAAKLSIKHKVYIEEVV